MKGKPHADLVRLAERLVRFGKSNGADEIEVGIGDGYEFSVDVRLGSIENLVEAGSRSMGVKVIKDQRTAFATSSDFSEKTLEGLIKNAIQRAELSNLDAFAGLPSLSPKRIDPLTLALYDPQVPLLDSKTKIRLALETERIALSDKRITNSHGAGLTTSEVRSILANSNGFLGEYEKTYCSLSVGLQAGETDDLVEDFWFSSQTHFKDLETPEQIAKTAVERTVRQLHPRKIKTQKVPVIFEPLMTSGLLGFLLSGSATIKSRSSMTASCRGSWAAVLLTPRVSPPKERLSSIKASSKIICATSMRRESSTFNPRETPTAIPSAPIIFTWNRAIGPRLK